LSKYTLFLLWYANILNFYYLIHPQLLAKEFIFPLPDPTIAKTSPPLLAPSPLSRLAVGLRFSLRFCQVVDNLHKIVILLILYTYLLVLYPQLLAKRLVLQLYYRYQIPRALALGGGIVAVVRIAGRFMIVLCNRRVANTSAT
jgi:hypothetical protein